MSKPAEDELNYDLVKREREKNESVVKSVLQGLFSNIGLVAIVIAIAILGNCIMNLVRMCANFEGLQEPTPTLHWKGQQN